MQSVAPIFALTRQQLILEKAVNQISGDYFRKHFSGSSCQREQRHLIPKGGTDHENHRSDHSGSHAARG
jgi:hypothetical protein